MTPVRSDGGHAWTLKGKCRFCGMTRVFFRLQNRPACPYGLSEDVRCDECDLIIGSLAASAKGSLQVKIVRNNSNCKRPPMRACPNAKATWGRAQAKPRPVKDSHDR